MMVLLRLVLLLVVAQFQLLLSLLLSRRCLTVVGCPFCCGSPAFVVLLVLLLQLETVVLLPQLLLFVLALLARCCFCTSLDALMQRRIATFKILKMRSWEV